MKLHPDFHEETSAFSRLSGEIQLVRQLSDASFREMDQERMITLCLQGIGEHTRGRGAALLRQESGRLWQLTSAFSPSLSEDLPEILRACGDLPRAMGQAPGEVQIRHQQLDLPAAGGPVPATEREWHAFPLTAEKQFLGILLLDLKIDETLPDELRPVLHQLCTGLLSIGNIRDLIMQDPMTGCYNRWYMDVELSKACDHPDPDRGPFALLIMDIDHFKQINDRHGHARGDQALLCFADLLRETLPPDVAAIRMGGDEFLLWIPDIQQVNPEDLGYQLLKKTRQELTLAEVPDWRFTLSMGLVHHFPSEVPLTKEDLLDRADHALYTSKQNGRDQLTVWTPELENQPWCWSNPLQPGETAVEDQEHFVEVLSTILAMKEPETGLHSQRVAMLMARLLAYLDFTEQEKTAFIRGSKLHDIGKIAIPEAILNKQGSLTESDWAIVRQHPVLGQRMTEHLDFLKSAGGIILHHHEHFDGSGYPDGLSGEEIPPAVRLFSVIDAYDSMRANRVYRPHISREQAVGELRRKSGSQFDPQMITFFLQHLEEVEDTGKWH